MRVDGLDVVEHPDEVRARVGYLPDHPPLYDEMTVHEYLLFAARLRGLSLADAERRAPRGRGATQLTGVSRRRHLHALARLRSASGIAQAIVHRPRLLVLDEPIAGLDPVQIVEMRELLRSLRHEHTILISSHILSEISETCDRILVIRDGEIVASGTEAELSSRLLEGGRTRRSPCGASARRPSARAPRRSKGVHAGRTRAIAGRAGRGVATFRVDADRDVREDDLSHAVHGNLGVLEVGPQRARARVDVPPASPEASGTARRRASERRTPPRRPHEKRSAHRQGASSVRTSARRSATSWPRRCCCIDGLLF